MFQNRIKDDCLCQFRLSGDNECIIYDSSSYSFTVSCSQCINVVICGKYKKTEKNHKNLRYLPEISRTSYFCYSLHGVVGWCDGAG